MRPNPFAVLILIAAAVGLWFSSVSTFDFVAHLDRQVHGIHCSFFPGMATADAAGTGCHVTLMSPYSSVLRQSVWGGVPISLPAMSVFAFLAFWAASLIVRGRDTDPRATGFMLLATLLPVGASLVMGYVSLVELDTVCKQCIGIYTASGLSFIGALMMYTRARSEPAHPEGPIGWPALGVAFGVGVLGVAIPFGAYVSAAPDFSSYVGACGQLDAPDDPGSVLVPLGSQGGPTTMIEVLDPLCPSCRGFEERFAKIETVGITRKALLFPLDNACNWMVNDAIHPGACAISEAVLCSGSDAENVLHWAFAHQEEITAAERSGKGGAAKLAADKFPALAPCIGSASARNKLNLALRYAVKNRLSVLTPQVYVQGLRLCDEDTDLGLEYALPRLIARAATMPPRPAAPVRPEPIAPPPIAARREAPVAAPVAAPTTRPAVNAEASADTAANTAQGQGVQPADQAVEPADQAVELPVPPEPAAPEPSSPAEPVEPTEEEAP
jgi:uncharacterized membrane protein